MFLKSVKARGFKSFARPVEFAFEPGITVVVGPNGSGKSNIADSVMWAMGEQSPSAVRGASMQDVIFSGSDKLPPAGMAEVEILLDNSKGLLPIEFSEVLVSRRLYRDGESAYSVNKSSCRLIDVAELLSDAGLGKSTHSIISQGRVDAILESKPAERRAYIEEAAGLGKYKKRRHRAELKLDAVRRNLDRLADVEEEVRSNLRPLKRQATAAERSARLEQQIAEARYRLIKGQIEAVSAQLLAAEQAADRANNSRASLEQELGETAAERQRTEEQLSSSLKDHKELAALYYGLKSRRDSLAGKGDDGRERLRILVASKKRLESRQENLRGQISRVEDELSRAENERRDFLSRMEGLENELGERQAELDRLEEEIARRRQAGEEKTRRVGELDALKDRYSHQIDYLSQRRERVAGLIERAGLEAQARRSELAVLAQKTRVTEERMAEWRRQAEAAEARLKELTAQRGKVDAARQAAATRLRQLEEDLKIAKARLTFISDSDRDRSGLPAAAKKISAAEGVEALVDAIEVEPGYEQAVSAVMGNMLFALAARDLGHARELLAKAIGAGLGGIEFMLPGGSPAVDREPGADYLVDHISFPERWHKYLGAPLAGVRVAAGAAQIGETGAWVTRDGIFYRSGRRLLSYRADPPASVVLKHRNERRLLETERRQAEAQYTQLETEMASLNLEHEELESSRLAAEKSLQEVLQQRRNAEGDAGATRRQQKMLEQEIELKEASRSHLAAEQEKLEEEMAEASDRLAQATSSLEEIGGQSGGSDPGRDESLAADRLLLSQSITELKISAARMRERERVAGQTVERSGLALARLRHELENSLLQLAAYEKLEPVLALLVEKIDRIGGLFNGVSEDLQVRLKEGEELAERRSARLRELSLAEAGKQRDLSRQNQSCTECEVLAAKLRDQSEDLESQREKLSAQFPGAGLESAEAAAADELEDMEEHVERLLHRRDLIGPVNPLAQQEYDEMLERQRFLSEQRADLEQSLRELTGLINELTGRIESDFAETFATVKKHFADVVATLFPGGEGRLTLIEPEAAAGEEPEQDDPAVETGTDDLEGEEEEGIEAEIPRRPAERRGIEISVKPARKAVRSLQLFSGGERSLVAIAFLFAIFLARPAPFYILDEVEAALDDSNITRLLSMLKRYQHQTQFIVITHQKRTMECANVLYGVSMGADGTSKVLSRRMQKDGGPDAAEAQPQDAEPDSETGKEAQAVLA